MSPLRRLNGTGGRNYYSNFLHLSFSVVCLKEVISIFMDLLPFELEKAKILSTAIFVSLVFFKRGLLNIGKLRETLFNS